MEKLGLVTVIFNGPEVLDGFFKSVSIQSHKDYILYLIDNSSTLESDKLINNLLLKYNITSYKHIKNESNVGVAMANNQGIELSIQEGTSHTILLNNDIEFSDANLFETILKRAVTDDETIVIPKILFYDSRKIWMAGGKFDMLKGLANHIGEGEENSSKFNTEKYFKYAPTCFMLINNRLFKDIGLMDEKYFVYFDDSDFLFRAYKKGYLVKYLPHLEILHKVSSSTGGKESLFSIYYSNRNRIYFIKRNFKGFNYFIAMFVTMTSRIWKYIRYNKEEKEKLIQAIMSGLKMK